MNKRNVKNKKNTWKVTTRPPQVDSDDSPLGKLLAVSLLLEYPWYSAGDHPQALFKMGHWPGNAVQVF